MLHLDWAFLPVFDEIDPTSAYVGVYHAGLVALSVVVAALAAFVALSISSRILAASGRGARWAWACAGATAMGGGIWGMHFIGMLAFSLPCGVGYDPVGTVLSMIPGILASGVALHVIARRNEPNFPRLAMGAVLMGAGIGAMHYTGMAAMQPEALLRYDIGLVALSVVVAIALAFLSLSIRFRFARLNSSGVLATLVAAPVMGCAVAGMHYTAMEASIFYPLANAPVANLGVSPMFLALLISIFIVLVMAITLVATFAGRQVELAQSLAGEVARRQASESDAESGRARLQAIFDAAVDGIVTADKRGRIQQWSSGARRILGYAPEEIVGQDIGVLLPRKHRSRDRKYLASFVSRHGAAAFDTGRELTAVRRDNSEVPVELSVSEVRIGGEVFYTGILRDITERKRVEQELILARQQAENANLAKSQFLATMSHEIRTPMNGVLGTANLLATTSLNDRQVHLVQNLVRSGEALLGIISDILDLSKIEAGRFELDNVEFEPRELIAEVTDLFCERCTSKGLEFVYFVDERVPHRLIGDVARLRQILINLVGNAMKFTERGEILVEAAVAGVARDEVMLSFSIKDTGIGIAAEQRSRIFESFHQVDASMTRSRGGTGLGLSIVKELVGLMGGQVGVESKLGSGSRFWFTARLGRAAMNDPARRRRAMERPLRVLAVDGNAVSAQVMSRYFSSWGLDAVICGTPVEGEAKWQEAVAAGDPFDVAIIDIKGLGCDGLKFARALRAASDQHPPVDVILLIGLDGSIADASLEDIGAFALLTKPARPSVLFDCLASIASGARDNGVASFFVRKSGREPGVHFDARVLVVEDNAVNQDVATGILESMGCRVATANNGSVAVQLFARERFDLILMDCEMPVMDGFEATRRIREVETALNGLRGIEDDGRVPIVALTAHALTEVRERCLRAGMDDFLVKPFDEAQMADMLGRWLTPGDAAVAAEALTPVAAGSAILAAATRPSSIDIQAIERIRAISGVKGEGLLQRVVAQFAATAPPLAATIRTKAGEGDPDAVWRAAHNLKSSAGALGAHRVSERCAEIEVMARENGTLPSEGLLAELDAALVAATGELHELTAAGAPA